MSDNEEIFVDVKVSAESIEKKNYVCEDCDKPFNSDQSLKKHLLISHHQILVGKEKLSKITYRFNCPVTNCRRSLKMDKEFFSSRKHLYQHFYKVHNTGKFSCTNKDCGKSFSTEMLRNLHLKNCGKVFTCHCHCCFNSKEALQTHQKRKHPTMVIQRREKNNNKRNQESSTRSVSTTTSGLSCSSNENLTFPSMTNTTSVFTSTDHPISSSKSTATDDYPIVKGLKNSSTSTEYYSKEENSNSLSSSSSQTKKTINWSGDFDDSINNLFDSDVKMEFYSAETQTDLNENLFNNNYTQTTFSDLYDFEKFDIQTQTNWDE